MRILLPRRSLPCLAALVCLAWGADARAGAVCGSDDACPPWAICTVSLGDCGSADAPYDVCTGVCVAGQRWRVVPRLGAGAVFADEAGLAATVGLEVVPPVLGGHLSVASDYWTEGILRVGVVGSWPVHPGLVLGARLDAATRDGNWGGAAAGRLEYFPWWPLRTCTPAHYFSLALESGVHFVDAAGTGDSSAFVTFGVGLWPRTW